MQIQQYILANVICTETPDQNHCIRNPKCSNKYDDEATQTLANVQLPDFKFTSKTLHI